MSSPEPRRRANDGEATDGEARREPPRPLIFGCEGLRLSSDEARFFRQADPLGFILFARNCRDPGQVQNLVRALRRAVGRAHAPVLIDQEGGRVARLGPPNWRPPPPARLFGDIAREDAEAAETAARLNGRLIAAELDDLGITIVCAPVLDLRTAGGDDIIGDRAFAADAGLVARLGGAMCEGLLAGGVLPVIKHIPGHGRAGSDSHKGLPVVDAAAEVLTKTDFAPFRALAGMPLAMTAHVVYSAFDGARPATVSGTVISKVIRKDIGFAGILISDDIGMAALSGDFATRAQATLKAGCDIVLHCSGVRSEMTEIAKATVPMRAKAWWRINRALAKWRRPDGADIAAVEARLDIILDAWRAE